MGILSSDRFEEIINNSSYKNYDCFIETGTYTGRSIIPLAKKNPKIQFHTIEIVKELYLFAKDKANEQDLKNIEFHLGDSVQILEKIIKNIKSDHLMIFLDAHSSSYEGFSAETIEKVNKCKKCTRAVIPKIVRERTGKEATPEFVNGATKTFGF